MTKYTGREIKAAVDREAARMQRPEGPGTWTADHAPMTDDEHDAYVARLVEDRLLPMDPPLVWRPYVDRSVVVRRA